MIYQLFSKDLYLGIHQVILVPNNFILHSYKNHGISKNALVINSQCDLHLLLAPNEKINEL